MESRRYTTIVRRVPPDFVLAGVDLWLGLSYGLQDEHRVRAAGIYLIAQRLMSLHVWGMLFIWVGLSILYVLWRDHRVGQRSDVGANAGAISMVRIGGPALFAAWAVMALLSALTSSQASFASFGLFAFMAYRHSFAPAEPDPDGRDAGALWRGMPR